MYFCASARACARSREHVCVSVYVKRVIVCAYVHVCVRACVHACVRGCVRVLGVRVFIVRAEDVQR